MILNCNVLHQIEAEKNPTMAPNEPTGLKYKIKNSAFSERSFGKVTWYRCTLVHICRQTQCARRKQPIQICGLSVYKWKHCTSSEVWGPWKYLTTAVRTPYVPWCHAALLCLSSSQALPVGQGLTPPQIYHSFMVACNRHSSICNINIFPPYRPC